MLAKGLSNAITLYIGEGGLDAPLTEHLGEVAQKYLHRGSKVYLEGHLQTRKWADRQGQERYTTEVVLGRFRSELVMLDSRGGGGGQEPSGGGPQDGGQQQGGGAPAGGLDDDVPFR